MTTLNAKHTHRRVSRNPLKIDPSRTKTIRDAYQRILRVKFGKLKRAITKLILQENAFGLGPRVTFNELQLVENTRFAFESDPRKLQLFQEWLAEEYSKDILPGSIENANDAYWTKYVNEAYEKGQGRAFDGVNKPALTDANFLGGAKGEFLRQSLGGPVAIDRVKSLAARNFTELKGVTEAISQQLSRHLVEGMAQGLGPREIASRMNKTIDTITKNRALVIARTETVRAHAEGQLDAIENLGVEKVRVAVEWSTVGDDRVCPLCSPMEGVVLDIKKARGIIPRHPNCRCAYIPANVGEPKLGQKRSKQETQQAFDESIKAEIPKRDKDKITITDQKKRSKWTGADTKPGAAPRSILDTDIAPKSTPTGKTLAKPTQLKTAIKTSKTTRQFPKAISEEEFNKSKKRGDEIWYRGIKGPKAKQYANELAEGIQYIPNDIFGSGTFIAVGDNAEDMAKFFAGKNGVIVKGVLEKDAKIISRKNALERISENGNKFNELHDKKLAELISRGQSGDMKAFEEMTELFNKKNKFDALQTTYNSDPTKWAKENGFHGLRQFNGQSLSEEIVLFDLNKTKIVNPE